MTSRNKLKVVLSLAGAAAFGAAAKLAVGLVMQPKDVHAEHENMPTVAYNVVEMGSDQQTLPPSEPDAMARLTASPRHGEFVMLHTGPAPTDSTRLWVVYPERPDKAPVVIVIHEIFGLSPWIRSVADQLAADGFIAIAPDFITTKGVPGNPVDGPNRNQAGAVIRALSNEEVNRQIDAVAKYGMALPAALPKYGVVGFCWGGQLSFAHATHSPSLGAAVVYYGPSPAPAALSSVAAPVLGMYASNDARVNTTIPAADSAMKSMNKSFVHHTFENSGHGFLRQSNAGNIEASRRAWPLTVQFFRTHLEAR
jgi:carboxymethylenebutenolidase